MTPQWLHTYTRTHTHTRMHVNSCITFLYLAFEMYEYVSCSVFTHRISIVITCRQWNKHDVHYQ